jgi:Asp-tRNA(Asn)/Glu-tRNA(Gln) amidotransferase A subunit family amidase
MLSISLNYSSPSTFQLSSEQVVTTFIKRIKAVNKSLNAVVEHRFTAAIEDAKKADKIITETSKIYVIENYPLLGVPFTVKESIEVKGMSKESGSVPRVGMKASQDAEVVKKLKAAGGIPLLVSTTPEFCFSWECSNLVTGRTNNPHDLSRTSGLWVSIRF